MSSTVKKRQDSDTRIFFVPFNICVHSFIIYKSWQDWTFSHKSLSWETEQRREARAVLRNPLVSLRGSQEDLRPQRLHQVFPTSPAGCQGFLVAHGWILPLWHRSEDSWCHCAQPSPPLAAEWHHSPGAAALGALAEEMSWMLIQQGDVVYFDMRLCFLSSLSTNSDDICFIFPSIGVVTHYNIQSLADS